MVLSDGDIRARLKKDLKIFPFDDTILVSLEIPSNILKEIIIFTNSKKSYGSYCQIYPNNMNYDNNKIYKVIINGHTCTTSEIFPLFPVVTFTFGTSNIITDLGFVINL